MWRVARFRQRHEDSHTAGVGNQEKCPHRAVLRSQRGTPAESENQKGSKRFSETAPHPLRSGGDKGGESALIERTIGDSEKKCLFRRGDSRRGRLQPTTKPVTSSFSSSSNQAQVFLKGKGGTRIRCKGNPEKATKEGQPSANLLNGEKGFTLYEFSLRAKVKKGGGWDNSKPTNIPARFADICS